MQTIYGYFELFSIGRIQVILLAGKPGLQRSSVAAQKP